MKKTFQKTTLIIGLLLILLFLFWSKLFLISLILLLIVDSFTTKILSNWLEKLLLKNLFKGIKYSYIILLPIIFAIFFRTFFFDFTTSLLAQWKELYFLETMLW